MNFYVSSMYHKWKSVRHKVVSSSYLFILIKYGTSTLLKFIPYLQIPCVSKTGRKYIKVFNFMLGFFFPQSNAVSENWRAGFLLVMLNKNGLIPTTCTLQILNFSLSRGPKLLKLKVER